MVNIQCTLFCQGCRVPRDVAFTLDSSGSIGRENFELVVNFVKGIAGRLPIERGTNIGMITYGDDNTV